MSSGSGPSLRSCDRTGISSGVPEVSADAGDHGLDLRYVAAVEDAIFGAESDSLVLSTDKSGKPCKRTCPTPVVGRAFETSGGERIPIRCGRNGCPVCRRHNAYVTAAMFGLDAAQDSPVLALTTTTRVWIPDWKLRRVTEEFVEKVRGRISPEFQYAWEREWTTGLGERSGGLRRTHYHWLLKGVGREDGSALLDVAREVYGRHAGSWVHHVQPVWDAAGFGRYIAGLVGHHLKAAQSAPKGWKGRRVGTSRRYYSQAASELRARAEGMVREERLIGRLERQLADEFAGPDVLEGPWLDQWNDALEREYVAAIMRPAPRVVPVPPDYWEREEVA